MLRIIRTHMLTCSANDGVKRPGRVEITICSHMTSYCWKS
jgi:hypothetical protein